jgi:uncharacterized protein YndB with AHSA1/START domain
MSKENLSAIFAALEFQDLGGSTRINLNHDFLPSEKSKQEHMMGWNGSFDCLKAVLN